MRLQTKRVVGLPTLVRIHHSGVALVRFISSCIAGQEWRKKMCMDQQKKSDLSRGRGGVKYLGKHVIDRCCGGVFSELLWSIVRLGMRKIECNMSNYQAYSSILHINFMNYSNWFSSLTHLPCWQGENKNNSLPLELAKTSFTAAFSNLLRM